MIDSDLLAGFGIALLAAIAYDSGYALQAFEARRAPIEQSMRVGLLAHLLRRPIWLASIALAIVGWGLQVVALTKAPLTLVQPVLALGLFLLLGLGVRVLGERVGRREWAAVAIIVVAVGLIAWAAPPEPGTVPRDAGLAVALGLLGVLTVAPIVASLRATPPVALLIIGAGAADGLAAFVTKIVSEEIQSGTLALAVGLGGRRRVRRAGRPALGVERAAAGCGDQGGADRARAADRDPGRDGADRGRRVVGRDAARRRGDRRGPSAAVRRRHPARRLEGRRRRARRGAG